MRKIINSFFIIFNDELVKSIEKMINSVDECSSYDFLKIMKFIWEIIPKFNFFTKKFLYNEIMFGNFENNKEYKRISKMAEFIAKSLSGIKMNFIDFQNYLLKFCEDLEGFDRTGEYYEFKKIYLSEETILNQNGFKKQLISQSYYFLKSTFKIKVLALKEGLQGNKNHWIGELRNSLKNFAFYFTGKITKDEIVFSFMNNFENNYNRLYKEIIDDYKKFVNEDDLKLDNIKKLAIEYYSKFADWIMNNRINLKNDPTCYSDFIEKNYN